MSRILISGASGFIGSLLVSFLTKEGHQVISLIRQSDHPTKNAIVWDPKDNIANESDFEGFDAVIHLAGEPLTLERWSKKKEKRILESRVKGTMFLSHLLSHARVLPKVFISASAIGFYGSRGEEELTEESLSGDTFLGDVCASWENASSVLKQKGVRVVSTRFGMVIGKGGALKKMLFPYKIGLGAILGSGKQWVSWIDVHDLVRAILYVIENGSFEGPVNFVSPNPIRQADFSKTLAQTLKQPHFLRVPSWLLRIFLGKTADELLLSSAKVIPAKLLASNFQFEYAQLKDSILRTLEV